MSRWLDCSASYSVVPTTQQVADLRALDFIGVIVGVYPHTHPKALEIIAAYEAGGMRIREYDFPNNIVPTSNPWWIDAELDSTTVDDLRLAMQIGAFGPYSRSGWAADHDWDCKTEFPNAELWDARYIGSGKHGEDDSDPCLIAIAVADGGDIKAAIDAEYLRVRPFHPYWGFTKSKMTQWHNSVEICGINMDINEMEEDGMASQEYTELYQRDEDIKAVVAKEATGTDFLIACVNAMAPIVFKEDPAALADLSQRISALEAARKTS